MQCRDDKTKLSVHDREAQLRQTRFRETGYVCFGIKHPVPGYGDGVPGEVHYEVVEAGKRILLSCDIA